ncbi:MAG: hypothetical protein ISS19_08395 [Bacteroidales bacterium]|nr:hypothetical protein [Bacteroidales bacterium]
MDKKSSMVLFGILPAVYLILAFIYIIFIVQPTLYFHHVQPPFILSPDVLGPYFEYPGGLSELAANFFMQSFYYKYSGPIVLFGIAFAIMWLIYALMNVIYKNKLNIIWALAPLTFTIVLVNNYNLPFSIIISTVVVLLFLLLLAKKSKSLIGNLIFYTAGAVIIYYFSGSGYMLLFSVVALFFSTNIKGWRSLIIMVYILGFTSLFPLLAAGSIFPIPVDHRYFYFFPPKPYFMAYEPSCIIYIYLLSVPVLLAMAGIMAKFHKSNINLEQNVPLKIITALAYVAIGFLAFISHQATYRGDGKKTVASDYYCYINNAGKTVRAATSMKDYNFAANLNYNLAMSKAGTLSDDFFGFFQVAGTDALHPDVEFSSEMSFIATDFYYNLGYISEARHWAYESLVFYPYSPRALQILVKIHLITREYEAAERCLNILSKGLIDRNLVNEYSAYIQDTALINTNQEIVEKRSFIPAEKELSPFIYQRFQELLEANNENKLAYEYLMLYYLLDSQLDRFMELYKDAGNYFNKPVDIYEEAILMYGEMYKIPVKSEYNISPAAIARFNDFNHILKQYEGNEKSARNFLYGEMGKSYMYYLRFVYPRIVKPEIINKNDEETSMS